jgi:hypothetical protein
MIKAVTCFALLAVCGSAMTSRLGKICGHHDWNIYWNGDGVAAHGAQFVYSIHFVFCF